MKRWRVIIRRDTIYDILAENELDAIEYAKNEDFDTVIESELDHVKSLECWEVAEDGSYLEE